jgi:hypothetical protein
MSKNLECWPFLYGRLWLLDYQTIIAPEFVYESKSKSILTNVANKKLTGEEEAFYVEINNPNAGELTLVFRAIETTFEEMNIEGSGSLKDSSGKEIRLTEGIVIKGWFQNEKLIVTKEDLEKAHEMLIEPYRELWGKFGSLSVTPSQPFSIPQDRPPSSCLQYRIEKPYVAKAVEPPKNEKEAEKSQESVSVAPFSKSKKWENTKTDSFYDEVTSAIFLPKGKSLAIRYQKEQTILIRNFETGKDTTFINQKSVRREGTTPIAISPNGQYMSIGATGGIYTYVVELWSIKEPKKAPKEIGKDSGYLIRDKVRALAFTPDSKILLSASKDNTIFFWDIKSRLPLVEPIKFGNEIRAIAVSPDKYNSIFAVGNARGWIESWDWKSGTKIKSFLGSSPNGPPINSLAFSPNGKILVSGDKGGSIKLWNVDTGEQLNIGNHSAIVTTVAFSPDGKLIASGDDRGTIKIWDIGTMKNAILREHSGAVTSVSFSPDGKTLASASKDRTVRFWERV